MTESEHLYLLQVELLKWQQYVKESGQQHIILFEGRDAAGKSSCIKRIMEHLNPRSARVVALDKPTAEEQREWYWQRYFRQLPRSGEITFWDRSWYNRAGVEKVMGFCTPQQTDHFLWEAPQIEALLFKSGIKLIKFWFSVSREEQAQRFTEREIHPLKLGKLSEIDRVSQTLWDEYTEAKKAMFKATDRKHSPWITIKSDSKPLGRIAAIQYILTKNDYPNRDLSAIGAMNTDIILVK